MTLITVEADANRLTVDGVSLPCAIGRCGAIDSAAKREGDGRTPIGRWAIRGALLRPDRVRRSSPRLPWRWLHPDDGWSDDPGDPGYNRPVRRPHRFSSEALWREDDVYDLIVVLGYNDSPPAPHRGSAIFLHVLPESGVTAGCVAVTRDALLDLLPLLAPGDLLEVRA